MQSSRAGLFPSGQDRAPKKFGALFRKISITDINVIYDSTQDYYKADLHHYFRFIYHILKFVKSSKEIDDEEKYTYTSILRATLSPYELALIFYNCLHEFGDSHFKPLVEEFSFLKNLDRTLLFIESQQALYHEVAFASSADRPSMLAEWKLTNENFEKNQDVIVTQITFDIKNSPKDRNPKNK